MPDEWNDSHVMEKQFILNAKRWAKTKKKGG